MRGASLLLCAGVVVVAAWRQPQVQPVVRKVIIRFSCDNDGGATVTVKPWRVVMQKRTDHVEWTLIPAGGVPSVQISPKYVAGWPFVSPPPITVTAQKPGVARDVPAAVPAGTYKYNITGVCLRGVSPPDTVIIDPDMIIPTLSLESE